MSAKMFPDVKPKSVRARFDKPLDERDRNRMAALIEEAKTDGYKFEQIDKSDRVIVLVWRGQRPWRMH